MKIHRKIDWLTLFVYGISFSLCCIARPNVVQAETPSPANKRALLIGCTVYDRFPERSLQGPANDVENLRSLLIDTYGFSEDKISTLIEGRGSNSRPIRGNIVRELSRLAETAQPDELLVLFFAGHGTQQPDQQPSDPDDPEPDGLDEVFLPADIGNWASASGTIENGLIDDEIRRYAAEILNRGSELIVIFDSCHSGSALRAIGDEVSRKLDPGVLGIPDEVDPRNQGPDETTCGYAHQEEFAFDPLKGGKWVAFYAAMPEQPTVELSLPRGSKDARPCGLLTYTLCQSLREGGHCTYRELLQRIQSHYSANGRISPMPMLEGTDLERGVLGAPRGELFFPMKTEKDGRKVVEAGELHGIRAGSILSVFDPLKSGQAVLGYVQVQSSGISQAEVSPCEFDGIPSNPNLPNPAMCRLRFSDLGDFRLKVFIDHETTRGADSGDPTVTALRSLVEEERSPLLIVEQEGDADWYVYRRNPQSKWLLLPRSSYELTKADAETARSFTMSSTLEGFTFTDSAIASIRKTLEATSRVANLERLAAAYGPSLSSVRPKVELTISVFPREQESVERLIPAEDVARVKVGDRLKFRLKNNSRESVCFTLLFIDSTFGIQAIFPSGDYLADNTLAFGKEFKTEPIEVTGETTGRERILLIAEFTKNTSPLKNFAFLAQPSLESSALLRSAGGDTYESDGFDDLLDSSVYQARKVRGLDQKSKSRPVMQIRQWMTIK